MMKIALFTKSYVIKTLYLFILILIIAGTPTKADASFLSSVSDFIFGNGAYASENEDNNINEEFGTDYFLSPSNMKLLGADSVEPDKKSLDECPELDINNGALQMDTYCGIGKGIESDSTGELFTYVVSEGDTISEVAEKFDISINTIKWENNITGNSIKVGQKLNILPVTGVKHIIKKGDTIEKIAIKYDAEVEDIKVFNGIDSSLELNIGDIMYVPNGSIKIAVQKPSTIKKGTPSGDGGSNGTVSVASGYYIMPNAGRITSPYGSRKRGFHYGIDIGAPRGTKVVAAASGTVVETISHCVEGKTSCGGRYGNYIVIRHSNGTFTRYAHLLKVSVSVGESVSQGERIGSVGNTGRSTGPHNHFQIEKANGSTIKPKFGN